MPDKYTYQDSEVLKNKFKVKDTLLLHAYERYYVTKRLTELSENPLRGNFDFKHLCKIHEHLFQDIYTWAGKPREIDIGKVDQLDNTLYQFCPVHRIDGFQEDVFGAIRKANYLKGLDQDQFSQKAAEIIGELNTLHPFREGNGRAQREFMRELALEAGWELNLEGVSQEQMIEASVATMKMDYSLMEDLIKTTLKPSRLELPPEYIQRIEEIKNADIGHMPKGLIPDKKLYDKYAQAAMTRNNNVWNDELDKKIIHAMKKAGISDTKISSAMSHSPALHSLSEIDKHIKIRTILRDVIKRHPELKHDLGYSR